MDNKGKKITLLLRILALAWMLLIFCFSAADGTKSSDTSHSVGRFLGRVFVSGYSEMSKEEQLEWADKIEDLLPEDAKVIRLAYGSAEEERIAEAEEK